MAVERNNKLYSQLDLWNKLNENNTLVADVFIVLCSVCNKLDIDLYKALKEKEQENINRIWKKENN